MSRWIAALASVLLVVGCEFPGTVKARAFTTGLRAGQSVRYQVHTVVSGTLTAGSSQMPVNSDQRVSETLKVDSVDKAGTAGTAGVTLTTDTLTDSSGAALTTKPGPAKLKIAADGTRPTSARTPTAPAPLASPPTTSTSGTRPSAVSRPRSSTRR